ncbi:hypothetical protein R1sor_010333 [Riccia sorocarpa]|uniref:Uncharacterized protein n=1 Tax=Riccia sorocarpa TaxID=122646 RepID=A0ABD3HXQ0_9MARC
MAEVWRDFAVVQAQTKAKKNEQREKKEHEQFVKFATLREEKQIENWRAMDANDRKKWDEIVATFPYGAENEYDSRTGYDPPRYEPIPRISPKPPGRPRLLDPPREMAQEEIERKKRARKPQSPLMQWSDKDLCAYYERTERQKKEDEEKRRRRLVHKRKYFPIIYRNWVAKVIWYHEFYRRLEIEVTIKRLKEWVELKLNPEPSEDEDSNKKNG